jgi:hypothetical protein
MTTSPTETLDYSKIAAAVEIAEGRKGSCEALAVMSQLHRAARQLDVPITMRRFDQQGDSVRLTFKVEKQKGKGAAKK